MSQKQLFDPFAPDIETEKEHLLQEMRPLLEPPIRLPFTTFVISILGMILICAILMPKIFLRNSIYYDSRDVTKLEHEYAILKEEQDLLKAEVEAVRYQNQIEDTLF